MLKYMLMCQKLLSAFFIRAIKIFYFKNFLIRLFFLNTQTHIQKPNPERKD